MLGLLRVQAGLPILQGIFPGVVERLGQPGDLPVLGLVGRLLLGVLRLEQFKLLVIILPVA